MKLLVFAHTPPPHHGQSFMVQVMLEGFGGDHRKREVRKAKRPNPYGIECYHVNARVSRHLEDIGDFRLGKFILMLGYCVQAIWCRYRYGVTNLYYVPAPGKKSALYRDWLVMALCRPFYKRIILHWHASGLARWLETVVQVRSRSITYRLAGEPDLSIVLSKWGQQDADKLWSKATRVVGNGIPDPCPDFVSKVLPRRTARFAARKKLLEGQQLTAEEVKACGGDPQIFRVVYLAHCTREKGVFDAVDAVAIANKMLEGKSSPIRLELTVCGEFMNASERAAFDQRIASPGLQIEVPAADGSGRATHKANKHPAVLYRGFVSGPAKAQTLLGSDCFALPSYYHAESFGLVLAEAMAFGMPIVATRWRSFPELLPEGYRGLIDPRSPDQMAAALIESAATDLAVQFREYFLEHFLLEKALLRLAEALQSVEESGQTLEPQQIQNRGAEAPGFSAAVRG